VGAGIDRDHGVGRRGRAYRLEDEIRPPAVAQALGGEGLWIDDTDTLAAEVEAALGRDAFTVLACRIARRAYDGKI
jgi:thiamine pyrophosphate-dependent acetolactate synthase large subunit-like protein